MFRSNKTCEQKIFLAFKISLCNLQLHLRFPLLHHSHFNHLKDKLYVQLRTPQCLSSKNPLATQEMPEMWVLASWMGKTPWRRKWQPTPVFLPGEFHGQSSLVGCSPWGFKESDTTKQLSAHTHPTESLNARINSWLSSSKLNRVFWISLLTNASQRIICGGFLLGFSNDCWNN